MVLVLSIILNAIDISATENEGTLVFKFSRGSSPFLSAEGAGLLPPLHKAADSAPATLKFPPATFFQFENSAEMRKKFADRFTYF